MHVFITRDCFHLLGLGWGVPDSMCDPGVLFTIYQTHENNIDDLPLQLRMYFHHPPYRVSDTDIEKTEICSKTFWFMDPPPFLLDND